MENHIQKLVGSKLKTMSNNPTYIESPFIKPTKPITGFTFCIMLK
jgi:hypothetical protein